MKTNVTPPNLSSRQASLFTRLRIGWLLGASAMTPAHGADTFANTGPLTNARTQHTATLLPNGKVLVAGGYNGTSYLTSVELYDPATGAWTATGPLATARAQHTATLLPTGKVLVAGGFNSSYIASAEIYDPSAGSWGATGTLVTARIQHSATLLPDGRVLVAGGANATISNLADAEFYDPANGTWTATAALNTGRRVHSATLLPGGKVLVAGGNGPSSNLGSAELYDPAASAWTGTGALVTPRGNHTATLLASGKVLIAGGRNVTLRLSSAELYDPAGAGTWSTTGAFGTGREFHTSTLLPNGTVLLAGGSGLGGSQLSSAQLYDPAAGTWSATGSLATARGSLTGTPLPNGQLLLAGGSGMSGTLTSAELYDSASGYWNDFNSFGELPGMTLFGQAAVSAGFLQLTPALGDVFGVAYFNDFGGGGLVLSFRTTFEAALFGSTCCGLGTAPGDGFSFNLVPASSTLTNPGYGQPGEEGLDRGLAVCFDTWNNGGVEAPAVDVKWLGRVIASEPRQVSQSPVGAPDSAAALRAVEINLDADGTIDVSYDGIVLINNVPTPYDPVVIGVPKWVFGARTGGANDNHWIDNLAIEAHAQQCNAINQVVTNNNDSGPGSLRAIIASAAAGCPITFAPNVRGAINLTSGELVIGKSLTISGPGANLLSVQRSAAAGTLPFRIFLTGGYFSVTLSGLTIANGSSNSGGGIYNASFYSTVNVTNCTISGNRAADDGGGIYNLGTTIITNCTISGNTAFYGGGIYNVFGTVNVTNSTISANSASRDGGGIYNFEDTVNVTNSTISANSAGRDGGGIANFLGHTLTVRNTIVAGNSATNIYPDVNGSLTSQGFNLIGNNAGAIIAPAQVSDQIGVTAAQLNLSPLQDNGGPTQTHALLSGSFALDKGNSSGSSTDQRGFVRLVDDPAIPNVIGGDGGDLGAFEFGAAAPSLKILSITRIGNGDVVLQVAGFPYPVHRIQASVDLSFGSFIDIATVTADASGLFQYQDTAAGLTRIFYRVAFP